MRNFIDLLKAARIHRTLLPLAAMLVPCAYASIITQDILFLALSCILVYMSASIQNASKDNDYPLPKYHKIAMIFLFVFALVISTKNHIIFLTVLAWLLLGTLYNLVSRYHLMADTTIMAITHFTIPVLSASLILKLPVNITFILTLFTFITFWFIMPMKNLVGSDEDKVRGYKTLATKFMKGRVITIILLEVSFLCMFLAYFVLNLSNKYLVVLLLLFGLRIIIFRNIELKREKHAVDLMRIAIMLFLFGLVIDKTINLLILALNTLLFASYIPYMIKSYRGVLIKSRVG